MTLHLFRNAPGRSISERVRSYLKLQRYGYRAQIQASAPVVEAPLILISQIQRSGGTLLSQLLDGHARLLAHPYELYMWRPMRWCWPNLDLTNMTTTQLFDEIFEKSNIKLAVDGYAKFSSGADDPEVFRFLFDVKHQQKLFFNYVDQRFPKSQREALNIYFTTYFQSWLDRRVGPYVAAQASFVVGFTPRVNFSPGALENYFSDYPDGYLISTVREPLSWFASAKNHISEEYREVEHALGLWEQSLHGTLAACKQYYPRVIPVTFDELISDTENFMRELCIVVGVNFDPCLLHPTYNGQPILPNSSFQPVQYGVDQSVLIRENCLTESEKKFIHDRALPLYNETVSSISSWRSKLMAVSQ